MLRRLIPTVPLGIWLYLAIGRGGYWRVRKHLLKPGRKPRAPRKVVAIIPARDEADVLERSVGSLLRQDLEGQLRIVMVDDGSSDGSAGIARRAAIELNRQADLQVLDGTPLPAGWTGKLWAVSQGIELAKKLQPDYFLLTDADIQHGPGTIAALLAQAEEGNFDLCSLMVLLKTDTRAEKLLIPAFVFFFFQLYPPDWVASATRKTAAAAGGCMLIRPEVLERIGGIEAIAGEIIDDCALAGRVKAAGGTVWMGLTESTVSIRSYGDYQGVGNMIARSAFNQLNHSSLLLIATLAGLFITYVLPPLLLFSKSRRYRALGSGAYALMSVSYRPVNRLYKQPAANALLLPVIALFYAGATFLSAVRYWTGTGGRWKGRMQDVRAS